MTITITSPLPDAELVVGVPTLFSGTCAAGAIVRAYSDVYRLAQLWEAEVAGEAWSYTWTIPVSFFGSTGVYLREMFSEPPVLTTSVSVTVVYVTIATPLAAAELSPGLAFSASGACPEAATLELAWDAGFTLPVYGAVTRVGENWTLAIGLVDHAVGAATIYARSTIEGTSATATRSVVILDITDPIVSSDTDTLWIWGDPQSNTEILSDYLTLALAETPGMAGYLGVGDVQTLEAPFRDDVRCHLDLSDPIAVATARGNHDTITGGSWTPFTGQRALRPFPAVGEFWAFTIAGCRVICLDNMIGENADQLEFLRINLSRAVDAGLHTIVLAHWDLYNQYWNNYYTNLNYVDWLPYQVIMEDEGCELCVSGHTHVYKRTIAMRESQASVGGVAYVCAGMTAAPELGCPFPTSATLSAPWAAYSWDSTDGWMGTYQDDDELGPMLVRLEIGASISLTAYRIVDGALVSFDTATI